MQLAQFRQSALGLGAQVEQLRGVLAQHAACVGQRSIARRAFEQYLAQFPFKLRDRLADRRLRPMQPRCSPREAALLRYRQKRFELEQIHAYLSPLLMKLNTSIRFCDASRDDHKPGL